MKLLVKLCVCLMLVTANMMVRPQSGGDFLIEKAVMAGGGGQSNGGAFSVIATTGQSMTGTSTASVYSIEGGFWTPSALVPTAAQASVSGIVVGPSGQGLRDSFVTVFGGVLTSPRVVRTNTFGRFRIEGLEVGQSYFVQVQHRRYDFSEPVMVVNLVDSVSDIRFQATQ